ncbi:MAG: hypothetical protein AAGB46_05030 [Verrucomicrobiota bacterium]
MRTLAIVSCILLTACGAPPSLPENFSQNTFKLDAEEGLLFEHAFSLNPTGWQLGKTQMADGALSTSEETRWAEAVLPILPTLDLAQATYTFYWESSTDPSKGQDPSALHIKLRLTEDPNRREQLSFNALTRAANNFYMFYIDPGFEMEYPHVRHPRPPRGFFSDKEVSHQFRIRISPIDHNKLSAVFNYWDKEQKAWSEFQDSKKPPKPQSFEVDIAKDLEGFSEIKAINFMFPHAAAKVTATALTRSEPSSE